MLENQFIPIKLFEYCAQQLKEFELKSVCLSWRAHWFMYNDNDYAPTAQFWMK